VSVPDELDAAFADVTRAVGREVSVYTYPTTAVETTDSYADYPTRAEKTEVETVAPVLIEQVGDRTFDSDPYLFSETEAVAWIRAPVAPDGLSATDPESVAYETEPGADLGYGVSEVVDTLNGVRYAVLDVYDEGSGVYRLQLKSRRT
jgi:hypothetical protein